MSGRVVFCYMNDKMNGVNGTFPSSKYKIFQIVLKIQK
jgi:hypothetical protein